MPKKFAGLLMLVLLPLLISFPAFSQSDTTGAAESAARMKANGCYAHANQLLAAKRYPDAIAKFKEAIALWPHSAPYHYNLAMALKQSGNGPEAITAFQKALEINPKEWRYYKALGNTQWRLRKFAEAKVSYESALKYAPAGEAAELKSGINACTAQVTPSNN